MLVKYRCVGPKKKSVTAKNDETENAMPIFLRNSSSGSGGLDDLCKNDNTITFGLQSPAA